jgi:hypothetical protein
MVARYADVWHSFADPGTFTHKSAVLDDWCRRENRDSALIERSVGVEGDPAAAGEDLLAPGSNHVHPEHRWT